MRRREIEMALGLKPGQSMPLERHGEMGRLYQPIIQLDRNEMLLHGAVYERARQLPDLEDTRDSFIRVLREVAAERGATEKMIERVLAYADELYNMGGEQ